jgi:hypothetical protein
LIWTQEEKQLESSSFQPLPMIKQPIPDLEFHSTCTSSHHLTSRLSTRALRQRLSLVSLKLWQVHERWIHCQSMGQVCGLVCESCPSWQNWLHCCLEWQGLWYEVAMGC